MVKWQVSAIIGTVHGSSPVAWAYISGQVAVALGDRVAADPGRRIAEIEVDGVVAGPHATSP